MNALLRFFSSLFFISFFHRLLFASFNSYALHLMKENKKAISADLLHIFFLFTPSCDEKLKTSYIGERRQKEIEELSCFFARLNMDCSRILNKFIH